MGFESSSQESTNESEVRLPTKEEHEQDMKERVAFAESAEKAAQAAGIDYNKMMDDVKNFGGREKMGFTAETGEEYVAGYQEWLKKQGFA